MQTSDPKGTKKMHVFFGEIPQICHTCSHQVFFFPFKNDPEVQTARPNSRFANFHHKNNMGPRWHLLHQTCMHSSQWVSHVSRFHHHNLPWANATPGDCGGICSSVLEVGIVYLRARHLDINKNDVCAHFPQRPSYTDIIYHWKHFQLETLKRHCITQDHRHVILYIVHSCSSSFYLAISSHQARLSKHARRLLALASLELHLPWWKGSVTLGGWSINIRYQCPAKRQHFKQPFTWGHPSVCNKPKKKNPFSAFASSGTHVAKPPSIKVPNTRGVTGDTTRRLRNGATFMAPKAASAAMRSSMAAIAIMTKFSPKSCLFHKNWTSGSCKCKTSANSNSSVQYFIRTLVYGFLSNTLLVLYFVAMLFSSNWLKK